MKLNILAIASFLLLSKGTTGSKVLLAATTYVLDLDQHDDVELLPLDPTVTCQKPRDYPGIGNLGTMGAQSPGANPIACGGRNAIQSSPYKVCYEFNPNTNEFEDYAELLEERYFPTLVGMDDFVWVTGGLVNGSNTVDTEIVTRDSSVSGPNLPEPLEGHCLLRVDSQTTFLGGGSNSGLQKDDLRWAFLYHWDTDSWEQLPSFTLKRKEHHCGLVTNDQGEQEIVVQGGFQGEKQDFQSVEVYNLASGQWRIGTSTPLGTYGGEVLPLGDSFLVLGGDSNEGILDTIFQYETDGSWTVLDAKFSVPRLFFAAGILESDEISACSEK